MNTQTDDYTKLTTSLADYTRAKNELAAIEAAFQKAIQELIAEFFQEEVTKLQELVAGLEDGIELLALKHPEWFEKTKTIKSPFGSVASRCSTKLEVPNEDATIALLEMRGEGGLPFLRQRTYLRIEALEALDDVELRQLRCQRVSSEKITITPAKVDLGKAVAKTAAKKKAAKKEVVK